MINNCLISIIVPIYNVEDYLDTCIKSICEQTYKNIEIILSDDGSTDNSGSICDLWAERDLRIKVVHSSNGGRIRARKVGADVATGDYVTTVDGDDWIEQDRIENIVANGIKDDEEMIFLSGWIKEYPERSELGEISEKMGLFRKEDILEMLSHTDRCFKRTINPSMCCSVAKRDIFVKSLGKIDDRIQMGDDVTFTWIALSMADKIRIIEDNRYHYIQRTSSINHTLTDNDIKLIRVSFEQVKKCLYDNNASKKMYIQLAFTYTRLLTSVGAKSFWGCESTFLFPFKSIVPSSRVIVYGAGDVGKKLVKFLQNSDDYICAGWIDKYAHGIEVDGILSQAIETISDVEYDYIAVAIVSADISEMVRKNLVELGVPVEMIAIMSPEAITMERTEKCLEG